MTDLQQLIGPISEIARQAGQIIADIYQQGDFQSEIKADSTPVTSADYAAHHFLLDALNQLTPDIPIISEEHADIPLSQRQHWQRYWLVDPLDGTQEFVAGSGDFATEIALIENQQPVLGVVYGPIQQQLYGAVKGQGAFKEQRGQRQAIRSQHHCQPPTQLRLATSRVQDPTRLQSILNQDYQYQLSPLGSASLKCCRVAEGAADAYIRLGPTGEWDTGAPQIILQEAGGALLDLQLQALSYNCRESLENPNFIAMGDPNLDWANILQSQYS